MAQVGLKDLHYALLTLDNKEKVTYGTTEAMAGAINATVNPTVNTQELYADDQLWESVSALGKVEVEVETADLPLPVRAKILGNGLKNGVLIERATDVPPHIAIGFKSLKSNGKYRYVWLLKGVAQPMAEDYSTKKDNVEHKTPTVKFTFMARMHDGQWKHTVDEDSEEFAGAGTWFKRIPGDSTVDKSGLQEAIDLAELLLGEAEAGDEPGDYPEAAFEEALDEAKEVNDNDKATQSEVDEATDSLLAAIDTFEAAQVTGED